MMLVWIDLETTGLNPNYDLVLEMAVGFATIEEPFKLTNKREWVFNYSKDEPEIRAMDSFVVDMHTRNGLLREVTEEKETPFDVVTMGAVERQIVPHDVSAVKLFCRSLGMPKLPKAEAHRAMADVEESVRHAEACALFCGKVRL